MVDVGAVGDELRLDYDFFVDVAAADGRRPHQVGLNAGDASSDSYWSP